MKIVIPVSQSDIARATVHAKVLKHFGGAQGRDLIYFATPSVADQAHEIAAINSARVLAMEVEPTTQWPIGPNQQFSALVQALGKLGNDGPFLWMETDMLPVRPRWVDALEDEYTIKAKPFMGNIVPFGMSVQGVIKSVEGDDMMMGCGVYPPGMHADERIRWAILNLGKGGTGSPRHNGHPLPFDVYLRNPMKAFGYADTRLISDQWNTGEYYEDEGGLHCSPLPFDRPHRPRGGIVDPAAVLVHGCKDSSLANLIFYQAGLEAEMKALPKPVAKPLPQLKTTKLHLPMPVLDDEDETEPPDTHTAAEADEEETVSTPPPPPAPRTLPAPVKPVKPAPVATAAPASAETFVSINPEVTRKMYDAVTAPKGNYRASTLGPHIKYAAWKIKRDLPKLGFKTTQSGWIKPTDELIAAMEAQS